MCVFLYLHTEYQNTRSSRVGYLGYLGFAFFLPVQRALQSQGHPDTWGPLLATAVAGHPLPAVESH